jgi:hypothetical protein
MSSSAAQFLMRNHVTLAKLSLGTGFLWGFAFTLQKGQTPFDAAQGAFLERAAPFHPQRRLRPPHPPSPPLPTRIPPPRGRNDHLKRGGFIAAHVAGAS